jgi:hypothetical protein
MSDQINAPVPARRRRMSWWGFAASVFVGSALLTGLTISVWAQQSPAAQKGDFPLDRNETAVKSDAASGPYAVGLESSAAIAAIPQDRDAPQSTAAVPSAAAAPPSQNVRAGGVVYGFASPSKPLSTRQGEVLAEQLVAQLVQQLRQKPEGEADPETLGRLRELVEKQFDLRHEAQMARLEKVLADAKQAQTILDQRAERKEEIVERRIAELLGQSDPLNWDYPAASPSAAYVSPYPYNYQIPVYSSPVSPYAAQPTAQVNRFPSLANPAAPLPATAPVQVPSTQKLEFTPPGVAARAAQQNAAVTNTNAAETAQNQDWIEAVFQYQNAQLQFEQRKQQPGEGHPSVKELQTTVAQAAKRLELRIEELKSRLEAATIRLESARNQEALLDEKLTQTEDIHKSGLVPRSVVLETKQQVNLAREQSQSAAIELRLLKSQLEWVEKAVNASIEQPQTMDEPPVEASEAPVEASEKTSVDE